jgi:ribosomal protein S12 methylthiotransferase accessory factor
VPAASFLAQAIAGAQASGVTRLADVTGLDRIGFPVWQAVRPAGRALSVHQGKGATPLDARIGALCEAIESHAAEAVEADGPLSTYQSLPPDARAPALTDYLRSRTLAADAAGPVKWCLARNLIGGGEHFLPHDLVSLDFTRHTPSPFERSSSGLAVGTSADEALWTALLEVIERDAIGEWMRRSPIERMVTALRPGSIGLAWLDHWRERLATCGATLAIHSPPSIVGTPVFVCTLSGPAEFGGQQRMSMGSATDADPEIALFRAFAEAVQSRLTLIAGARDDILPRDYMPGLGAGPPVPPAPPGFPCRSWGAIAPGPTSLPGVYEALERQGYLQIITRRLGAPVPGIHVVKLFVPGLASSHRTRRPEQWAS